MNEKTKPNYFWPPGNPSQLLKQTQTHSEGVEDDTPSKWHLEKSGCSNTYIKQNRFQDFKKKVTRDRDEHFVVIKGTIHQEDIRLINIFAPNLGAPKYIKQLLQK